MTSLALAVLLLSPARAAEPPHPRCPDGSAPRFSGRPLEPLECPRPGEDKPGPEVQLSSSSLPSTTGSSDALSLKAAVGRWEGMAVYGMGRFETLLIVEKAGSGFKVRLESKDYRFLTTQAVSAELKGRFFGSKGRYDAVATWQALPKDSREGIVLVGPPAKPDPAFDREAVLVYRERNDVHRLRFKVDKDVLRYRYDYTFAQPRPGAASASGELRRTDRTSL